MGKRADRIRDVCREYVEPDTSGDDEFRDRDWEALSGVYRGLVGKDRKKDR